MTLEIRCEIMKMVPRSRVIYFYSAKHEPAEHVKPNEPFVIMTEDAFGGQIRNEGDTVEGLDWSRLMVQQVQCSWKLQGPVTRL